MALRACQTGGALAGHVSYRETDMILGHLLMTSKGYFLSLRSSQYNRNNTANQSTYLLINILCKALKHTYKTLP